MAKFGLFQKITKCLFDLGLDVIDHRSTHEHGDQLFLSEVYARDRNFPGSSEDSETVSKRLEEIQEQLLKVIDQPVCYHLVALSMFLTYHVCCSHA